jgi:hypothetical protein
MTEYIAHRANTISHLTQVPQEYGVEIDLRPYGDELIVEHDPFVKGELFSDYIKHYRHGTLILNIKSEGIEHKVLELVRQQGIKRYFFLDCSFPRINAMAQAGERNMALRFSEYEGLDTLRQMAGMVEWVWVDCFTRLPIDGSSFSALKKLGYRLCLVSPELQGRPQDIAPYRDYLRKEGVVFDAICTKLHNIPLWEE